MDPDLSEHLLAVMNEVLHVASKVLDEPLPSSLPTPQQVLKSTRKDSAGGRPSMYGDWEKGNRMELEVILGNPIRIARQKGIDMPRLQTMYALLRKAQERRSEHSTSKL